MSRLARLICLLAFAAVPLVALAQDSEPERLRIHGSNVLGAALLPDMVDSWLKNIGYEHIQHHVLGAAQTQISASRDGQPLVVEIDKRGSASGFAALVSGSAELAMSSRPPDAQEMDAAWQLGDLRAPGQEWVLGLDGLAILVAPSSPLHELTLAQLGDLVAGRQTRVAGINAPLRIHAMSWGSGADELLGQLLLKGGRTPATIVRHDSYASIVAAMQDDPTALGIVGLRAARGSLRALAIRSGGRSAAPDRLSMSTEDYPLQHRLYLHSGQLITALGRGLALYAISDQGQAVVARSAFVPLNLVARAGSPGNDAPAEYSKLVAGAQRLPMTVRFSHGLDFLDSRSRQDMDRLAEFMARPENSRRRILLLGFANPQPRMPYQALSLSQERVDYLASELLDLHLKVTAVRGFGGLMNLVDADLPAAASRNDRVEVWLR